MRKKGKMGIPRENNWVDDGGFVEEKSNGK